ncbi:hypothetical protein [Photobacterium piscicola]|uniref:hypothetical protein n=1 Tax=Photobacterium piscicola TaxID=1378299 RepID=UPI0037370160
MSVTDVVDNNVESEAIHLDMKGVNDAITVFEKIISSEFINAGIESKRIIFNSIIYNGVINKSNEFDNVKKIIDESNYNLTTLEKEKVILFNEPIFISSLICSIENTNIEWFKKQPIRIISGKNIDKKYITDSNYHQDFNRVICRYIINDIVYGLIFTNILELKTFKYLSIIDFLSNDENLKKMMDAHQDLSNKVLEFNKSVNEKYDILTSKIADSENKYNIINSDVDLLSDEQVRLEESKNNYKKILQRIQKDIEQANKDFKTANIDISNTNKLIEEREVTFNRMEKDIKLTHDALILSRSELEITQESLRQAKKDTNLISFDMKGFNSESRSQLRYYYGLAFCVIAFLATVFSFMYRNAQTFETIAAQETKLSLLDILLSRLPLITATTLVIGTLSALLFYLINHIMIVNLDKMNMLKASILAEQITSSLPENDMTDDKIREFQRNIKIELVMNVFSKDTIKLKKKDHNELIEKVVDALSSIKKQG